jgi:hypothetical protein
MKIILSIVAALAALLATPATQAIIIGGAVETGDGAFIKLTPGFTESDPDNTVGKNTFQNTNLYGFDESQNVAIGAGGLLPDIGSFLDPGTIVASHYVFYDPKESSSQTGYVLFDADILALLTTKDSLAATDYLAETGVNYLNPKLRGLEKRDDASINVSNPKRIDVDWRASSPGDYIRILTSRSPNTATVPDASSALLLLGGSLGLLTLVSRKLSIEDKRGVNPPSLQSVSYIPFELQIRRDPK